MFKPVAVLVAVAGGALGLVFLLGPVAWKGPATLGFAITLPPAVFTLLAVALFARRWPQVGVTVIAAGTALRLAWAVLAVVVVRERADALETTPQALAEWTVAFYLLLLTAETALLRGVLDRPAPRTGRPSDDPQR